LDQLLEKSICIKKLLADIKRKNSGNKQLMDAIAVIEK
jgi:hypothetical protein